MTPSNSSQIRRLLHGVALMTVVLFQSGLSSVEETTYLGTC